MRRILVDAARRRKRLKRGGDQIRHELEEAEIAAPEPREDLLALDEALDKLAATDRQAAELVKLRYFAGLPLPDPTEQRAYLDGACAADPALRARIEALLASRAAANQF